MCKKIIIINLFLMLITTTAFAYTDASGNSNETLAKFKPNKVLAAPKSWGDYIDTQKYPEKIEFNPFYIGFSGGLDIGSIRAKMDSNETSRLSTLGGLGTLTLGYGGKYDIFYIGLAIDGALSSANNNGIKMPYTLGAYLIPGVFLSHETMLYLKLGGVNSEFKADSFKKNIWGGRAGLGVHYYCNKYFSLYGEYVFSYYQDAKDTNGTKYSPLTNQFNLGFAFHLGT